MRKVYTKRLPWFLLINLGIVTINLFVILAVSPISYSKCGSDLQEFAIVDKRLDSLTKYIISELYRTEEQRKRTMVIELNKKKDSIDVVYSFHNWSKLPCESRRRISDGIVGVFNRRVLGYVNIGKADAILLTNIDFIDNVYPVLDKLISPVFYSPSSSTDSHYSKVKYFDNISYSSYPYWMWKIGTTYEPMCVHVTYYKDSIYSVPRMYPGVERYE